MNRYVVEEVQRRLNANPEAMRMRRETVEHPFGTIKARMGATHFLMKQLPNIASEMALLVLAYDLTRALNIMGVRQQLASRTAIHIPISWPLSAHPDRCATFADPAYRASAH